MNVNEIIIPFSGETKKGVPELWDIIDKFVPEETDIVL